MKKIQLFHQTYKNSGFSCKTQPQSPKQLWGTLGFQRTGLKAQSSPKQVQVCPVAERGQDRTRCVILGSLDLHTAKPAHSSVLASLFLCPVAGARAKSERDLEILMVFSVPLISVGASLVAQQVLQMQKMRVRSQFDPWVGKIPWRRKWQPTPVFLLGKSHEQRSLMGYGLWGCKILDPI